MKAVWKKLIAVAFCGATAASMLSVGASAAWYNDNLIEYGMFAENSKTIEIEDDKGYSYGSVYVSMKAANWVGGKVSVDVDFTRGVTGKVTGYNWSGNVKSSTNAESEINYNGHYTAKCTVSVQYSFENWKKQTVTIDDEITVSVSGYAYANQKEAQDHYNEYSYNGNKSGYYNDKWYDRYDWDKDKIYWDGDYYWYYSGGR